MESLAEIIRKYGLRAGLIIIIPIMLPYVEKYFDRKTTLKTEAFVYKIKDEMMDEIQRMLDNQTAVAIKAHSKTRLNDKQALYLMKTSVGFQSIHKVEWLKQYLSSIEVAQFNDVEYSIKTAIRSELTRQSSIYTDALNEFTHPKLGNLGNFVDSHLDMHIFLNGIYNIIFNSTCNDCDAMYNNIMYHMLNSQNQIWKEAEKVLESK